jgi:multidrug efflux pump subunit AcrA (membrane-fusion protein)
MKHLFFLAIVGFVLVGCHRPDHEHKQGEQCGSEASHEQSHGEDAQSFSGATHKAGKGITLLPQTKEELGVTLDEVREEKLPLEISLTARVFSSDEQRGFQASGILPTKRVQGLKKGFPIKVQTSKGVVLDGRIGELSTPISTNETEVVVEFSADASAARIGTPVRVTVSLPANEAVTTIPKEALIKCATESFVYVQNEDAYLRTIVQPGRETADAVEIKDGLLEGDFVVSRGAMDLWLVELRAVKGGQGCCPAPPAKGKGK